MKTKEIKNKRESEHFSKMVAVRNLRIGVLAGGPSNEREISLQSGKAIFKALKEAGAEAVFLDIKKGLSKSEAKKFGIDIAFVALHGKFGEDGTIQKILEDAGIPYTGSGPSASRVTLDKVVSRGIFVKAGLNVPMCKIITKKTFDSAGSEKITQITGFPVVVKPQFEGSSIGISIVKRKRDLKEAIELAFCYGENVIIEEYIAGRELTVGILEDNPLPVIEIVVKEQFYNFKAKYKRTDTEYIVPADVSPRYYEEAQAIGRLAHRSLGCESFSRVDLILDEKRGKIFILEVNSIPGFTSHSLLPKAAAYAGIDFNQLCLKIVESAFNKRRINKVGKKDTVIQFTRVS